VTDAALSELSEELQLLASVTITFKVMTLWKMKISINNNDADVFSFSGILHHWAFKLNLGLHGLVCKKASARHHALKDLVARAIASAGISVSREPQGLSRSDVLL